MQLGTSIPPPVEDVESDLDFGVDLVSQEEGLELSPATSATVGTKPVLAKLGL